ncbi:Metalloendopeptidase OMA1, mitochondrial, partial [Stegodyphus mimosarum]
MLFLKCSSFLLDKSHISLSIFHRSSNHQIKSIFSIISARMRENCCIKIANRNFINRNRNTLLNHGKLYCRVTSKDQNLCFAEKILKYSQCSRYFHTSERRNVHPVVWIVFRPLLKLVAVLTGRGFRKWWRDLPSNKRKYFLNVIKENRKKIGS